MKKGKRFVGDKSVGPLSIALKPRHREIRVVSTLFVYNLAMVVTDELGTIGGAAHRTAIGKEIAIIKFF